MRKKKITKFVDDDNFESQFLDLVSLDEPDQPRTAERDDDSEEFPNFGDSKTITAHSYIEYSVNCYATNKFLENLKTDKKIISRSKFNQFEYDYDKYSEIYLEEFLVFIYKNKLHLMTKDINTLSIHVDGEFANQIYNKLTKYIRSNNVLKNKLIYVSQGNDGLSYKLTKPKDINLSDVIIDDKTREDIYDNVIYHLEEGEGNNGLIFYGPPGTGKSITCSALINEVIKRGYTACYLTEFVNFDTLQKFIDKMLSPCLFIFEDLDSLGQSREDGFNPQISALLQFLNGLADKNNKQINIATTNYLEHLDKALVNRPHRFNRKFFFDYATNKEIDLLIDRYFKDLTITDENKELCYQKNFTGSHITELKRTCNYHVKKYNKKYNEIFPDCVDIITKNFATKFNKIGY